MTDLSHQRNPDRGIDARPIVCVRGRPRDKRLMEKDLNIGNFFPESKAFDIVYILSE